jgi:hypothetical protein
VSVSVTAPLNAHWGRPVAERRAVRWLVLGARGVVRQLAMARRSRSIAPRREASTACPGRSGSRCSVVCSTAFSKGSGLPATRAFLVWVPHTKQLTHPTILLRRHPPTRCHSAFPSA